MATMPIYSYRISKKCCSKSVSGYESETSGAGTSNNSGCVLLNAPLNLINDPKMTSISDRFKITDNAATIIMSLFIKAEGILINFDYHLLEHTEIESLID